MTEKKLTKKQLAKEAALHIFPLYGFSQAEGGREIVVIGGTVVGSEIALYLFSQGVEWVLRPPVFPGHNLGQVPTYRQTRVVMHERGMLLPLRFIYGGGLAPLGMGLTVAGLYEANKYAIEKAPQEEQASLWRMFSQGLTGTGPGVGSGISF